MHRISSIIIFFIIVSLCPAGHFKSLECAGPSVLAADRISLTAANPCHQIDWGLEDPFHAFCNQVPASVGDILPNARRPFPSGSLKANFIEEMPEGPREDIRGRGSSPASGYLRQNGELKGKGTASEASTPLMRTSLKSNRSNVVISEPVNCAGGTDLLGICALRSQNFSGQNISIAIIDYQYYVDRLSERELPKNRIQLFNGTFSEDSRHGTACAEIIGDVAPNVTLYMIGLEESSVSGFKEAVDKLLNWNKRIDIVSCSIDFSYGLFDKGDSICRAVRNLTKNGTIWITSAGDEAQRHWQGTFRDENENAFNEFGPGDEALNLTLQRGMPLEVWLSWNDSWSNASQDYDLYVFAPDGTYAISKKLQDGHEGQEPVEMVFMLAPVSGNYSIKIRKYSASRDNTVFQLFASQELSKYNVESSSLGGLASCPEVITVGAVDVSNLQRENYSSMGPTIDGRLKPEFVAPDNVTTASYLPEKFQGSSASVPYAAGIFALALEKGRKLGLTDEEIVQFLLNSAIDLGPKGPENEYGYGLINLKSFAEL